MKHQIIAAIFLFGSVACHAQEIKVNEIDKFTNTRSIETEYIWLNTDKGTVNTAIKYGLSDTSKFITIKTIRSGKWAIVKDQPAILLFTDGSTAKVYSIGVQSYDYSGNILGNFCEHRYKIYSLEYEKLTGKTIKGIRIYFENSYSDIEIPISNKSEPLFNLFNTSIKG